jgi:hypothetical protein
MAKQGPAGAFHLLEVASTCFGSEACVGHLQDMECTNTSPKTIEDYNYYTTNIQLLHNYHTTAIHLLYN